MSVLDVNTGGTYATLSAAITGSYANDTLQISAGTYVENFPGITHSLTIQATGGIAYLSNPQPDPPNGRAVINVPGNVGVNLTLSGLDISGAVDDASNPPSAGGANGAGILFESGNGALVVSGSHIHGNEDGILTGGGPGMTVTITGSEIDHNGVRPSNPRYGYDHNIYVGSVQQFTLTASYVHDALGGNEVKSRALSSTIENNRIFDNSSGASYEIDLPNGGSNQVLNNTIEKGAVSPQDAVADTGAETSTASPAYAGSWLVFSGNTVVNDSAVVGTSAYLISNDTVDPLTGANDPGTITANTIYGITDGNIFRDFNGMPNDIANGNQFLPLSSAPALDMSSLFAVTEPPMPGSLMMAFLSIVLMARRRRRLRAW